MAIESPLLGAGGSTLLTGKEVTVQKFVEGLSEKTGKKVVFEEVNKHEFLDQVIPGVFISEGVHDMFAFSFCGELG